MAAGKSGHERELWTSGCSLTLAFRDAALEVFGAALDNDFMTPLCFSFCLRLSVCPPSSLTSRVQLVTNFILNIHWDSSFSRLERREEKVVTRIPPRARQDGTSGAVSWRGSWRRQSVVISTSLEYKSTAWNERGKLFCWNDAGFLLYWGYIYVWCPDWQSLMLASTVYNIYSLGRNYVTFSSSLTNMCINIITRGQYLGHSRIMHLIY